MTIFLHELKRNRLSLIIWSAALSFMLAVCVLIYPIMEAAMDSMMGAFAEMEGFSEAFGMDQLATIDFMEYFAVECGEMMGLGGAIFAAILGSGLLPKEERDRTAEFLLTHPISRTRVVTEKLLAALTQITLLNIAVAAISLLSTLPINVDVHFGQMGLLFLSYYLLQIEIAAISIGISAFLRRGSLGIGLGLSLAFYFINLLANITEDLEFLKYVTPFAYADGTYIVTNTAIDVKFVLIGLGLTVLAILAAYRKYTKKDIA